MILNANKNDFQLIFVKSMMHLEWFCVAHGGDLSVGGVVYMIYLFDFK